MSNKIHKQISNTASIILNDTIERVFLLFSPLEEKKWVSGWEPTFIYPTNGAFKENLVFTTKSGNTIEKKYRWILSCLNLKDFLAIYTVSTENRIWTIKVQCEEFGKEKTQAEIRYTYTGFNERGNTLNRESLEKMYRNDLKDWEAAINYYLEADNDINEFSD